jgi:hypothetical protein
MLHTCLDVSVCLDRLDGIDRFVDLIVMVDFYSLGVLIGDSEFSHR